MSDTTDGYAGLADAYAGNGPYNNTAFLIQQLLANVETCALVQVKAVKNAGELTPVGFVDVAPLVNQLDGAGNSTPHGTIYHLPYFRLQGGTNAIILDPQVGDIGMAGFCSRDISAVKVNKAQSNPGSRRKHDPADGIYFGGMLNGTPVQYIQFNTDGITLVSPTKITIQAPEMDLNGIVKMTGSSVTHNGHEIGSTHAHTDVQNGGGISGPPV